MTRILSIILIITFTLTTVQIIPPFVRGDAKGVEEVPLSKGGLRGLFQVSIAFASDKITPYPPETKQTPALEEVKEEKGGVSWLWIILGIAAVGGIAAAAGGGKSDSSSSGGGGGGGSTGTTTIT